jgi:hypothetical protein
MRDELAAEQLRHHGNERELGRVLGAEARRRLERELVAQCDPPATVLQTPRARSLQGAGRTSHVVRDEQIGGTGAPEPRAEVFEHIGPSRVEMTEPVSSYRA